MDDDDEIEVTWCAGDEGDSMEDCYYLLDYGGWYYGIDVVLG